MGLQIRHKLSALKPILASTPQVRQAPSYLREVHSMSTTNTPRIALTSAALCFSTAVNAIGSIDPRYIAAFTKLRSHKGRDYAQ